MSRMTAKRTYACYASIGDMFIRKLQASLQFTNEHIHVAMHLYIAGSHNEGIGRISQQRASL
ncbi:hypothetical protein FACS1894111_06320 [Clostridia bacterium]|nr:hypothetical protein FACS1894111_06320 [Clostridia bacterium]